jgi:alpha-D-ribose 1-methylphosphonate 5-triphosphate synthase subunit PhnH
MDKEDYKEAFRAQKIFRDLLDAFSRPFRVVDIESSDDAVKELCFVLLDSEVSFYVDEGAELMSDIKEMTYAKTKDIESADFVILTKPHKFEMFDKIKRGTLSNPHKGATVIAIVNQIYGEEMLTAQGPGIKGKYSCCVDKSIVEFLDKAAKFETEYPKGFELLFTTHAGEMLAVPRRVKVCGRDN